MPEAEANNGNQKVTNALLGYKIDALTDTVERCLLDHETRIRTLETRQTELRTRMNVIGTLNAAGNIIAGAVGALFGPK